MEMIHIQAFACGGQSVFLEDHGTPFGRYLKFAAEMWRYSDRMGRGAILYGPIGFDSEAIFCGSFSTTQSIAGASHSYTRTQTHITHISRAWATLQTRRSRREVCARAYVTRQVLCVGWRVLAAEWRCVLRAGFHIDEDAACLCVGSLRALSLILSHSLCA